MKLSMRAQRTIPLCGSVSLFLHQQQGRQARLLIGGILLILCATVVASFTSPIGTYNPSALKSSRTTVSANVRPHSNALSGIQAEPKLQQAAADKIADSSDNTPIVSVDTTGLRVNNLA